MDIKKETRGWSGSSGSEHPTSKQVVQKTKAGKLINPFDSIEQASDYVHTNKGNITKCCQGVRISAGGFAWAYKHPELQKCYQKALLGEVIKAHHSILLAANRLQIDKNDIIECCLGNKNTAGGFKWSFRNK